ncbi:MAG: ACT domain-containing protein [Spirochaetota bacterium]|nr:MAG: ACT domain-containing protein [Spirochaetota bacterium]
MKIKQVSIFLENRAGRILEITEVLGQNKINIRALSLADTSDFGILRMIVDDATRTMNVLKDKGFIVKESWVVAVEVPDKPGGLASVLRILGKKDINVEYMYAFFEKPQDKALLIFRFEDPDEAVRILQENGIEVSGKQKLGLG